MQARNFLGAEVFYGGEVFLELGHFDEQSSTTRKRKAPPGFSPQNS